MPLIKSTSPTGFAKDAIVLDLGDLQRQGEQIIAQARDRAAQIITNGNAERERLIAGAAEEGRAAGMAKGLEEGRLVGMEQGRAAALSEHGELLTKLSTSWIDALERSIGARQHLLAEGRREVIELAARIAEKVVKRSIQLDPSIVTAQVEAVLGLVMRPSRLTITIHPLDRPVLEAALPALVKPFTSVAHVEMLDDDKLARGSCIGRLGDMDAAASTPAGEIDASINTQLERIVEALLPDGIRRGDAGDAPPIPPSSSAPAPAFGAATETPSDAARPPPAPPAQPAPPAPPETTA